MNGSMKFTGGDRFWTADLHLGHPKVADLRGFASVREHDTHIMGQLAQLDDWDTLWVLGDISSGKPEDEAAALTLLREMCNARMQLVAGNHDSVSAINRNGFKHQREWLETFESVQQFGRVRLNGANVLMSHFPFARSGDGPGRGAGRHNEFRLPDTGLPLIHGHTHQTEPHMQLDPDHWFGVDLTDRKQFCVSWDAHRGLVSEHTLNQWIEGIK